MKKTILTFGILAIMLGFVKGQGQQVSNSAFVTAIGALNAAINSKSVAGENSDIERLNGMMSTQMAYINSIISTLQPKYVADTTVAGIAWRAAKQEVATAQTALASAQGSAIFTAQQALNKANSDQAKATSLLTAAKNVKNGIDLQTTKLATEQQVYNEIQPLKNHLIPNQNRINADLKVFAGTLQ